MFVYIQPTEGDPSRETPYEWRPGKIFIPRDFPDLTHHMSSFAEHIADVYSGELVRAIETQRFHYNWDDLSVTYFEYKKKKSFSTRIWERTGLLKKSITYWREEDKWVVGIDKYLRYPDTNVPVYKVCRYMEYGTSKMPPRPLFRPLQRYISRHIRRFWRRYASEVGIDLHAESY